MYHWRLKLSVRRAYIKMMSDIVGPVNGYKRAGTETKLKLEN